MASVQHSSTTAPFPCTECLKKDQLIEQLKFEQTEIRVNNAEMQLQFREFESVFVEQADRIRAYQEQLNRIKGNYKLYAESHVLVQGLQSQLNQEKAQRLNDEKEFHKQILDVMSEFEELQDANQSKLVDFQQFLLTLKQALEKVQEVATDSLDKQKVEMLGLIIS